MVAYADCQPLLSDQRLEQIEDTVRKAWPMLPDESRFATAIVPHGETMEAHFLIATLSPRPLQRKHGMNEVARGVTTLAAWDASERERKHYVTKKDDPALGFFLVLAKSHIEKLDNLKSIMN